MLGKLWKKDSTHWRLGTPSYCLMRFDYMPRGASWLVSFGRFGASFWPPGTPFEAELKPHKLIEIRGEGGALLIALDYDGGATFGDSYTPEDAVRIFWESVVGRGGVECAIRTCEAHDYTVTKLEQD